MPGPVKNEREPDIETRARNAVKEGNFLEAARWFLEAHKPYDAAVCFQKANLTKECLDALIKVPPSSMPYRAACVHAVRIAFSIDQAQKLIPFTVPFVATPPTSPAEATAYRQIAGELAKAGKKQHAIAVFERVLAAFPNDDDAKESLAALPKARETVPPKGGKKKPFKDILVENGLPKVKLQLMLQQQASLANDDVALGDALVVEGHVSELDVLKALSEASGIPYVTASTLLQTLEPDALKTLAADQAEKWQALPIALIDRQLLIAMRDPRDIEVVDQLRFAAGVKQVTGVFASELGIRKGIRKAYFGEEEDAGAGEDWRMWEQSSGKTEVSRFSDRVTRTREQEFDTQEMVLREQATADAEAVKPMLRSELESVDFPGGVPPSTGKAPAPLATGELNDKELDAEVVDRPEIAEGTLVNGRYRIVKLLGKGGSATVYRAHDTELGEDIALKVFGLSAQNDAVHARFKLELSLSRQLAHPNVIRLFDLGSHEKCRYLTMELLEGTDLGSLVQEKGPLPLREGLIILEQACAGLAAAHERGVIHRDVKPRNLFITKTGVVKVMDFGIAKKDHVPGVTVAGTIAGTPEYMSPEQINGFSTVTYLTDLYALGASAYETFTGSPPFTHQHLVQLLLAQASEAPEPPRHKNPAIPAALEEIILKLLQKKPEDRYQSAAEVGAALRRVRESL